MRQCWTGQVLATTPIVLLLSISKSRVTTVFLGHTCPSYEETSIRPISQWKGSPYPLLSLRTEGVYWNPFCPPGTQRSGPPTNSSYCSSSESSGQLLARHLLPRYLKPHFSSPLGCLPLPTFLPTPKTFKTGIRQSNWHLFLVSPRSLVWSAATLTPLHLTFRCDLPSDSPADSQCRF